MSLQVTSARAFWAEPPGEGVIRAVTLDPPRDGEALIETLYSGVSRGTESLVHQGRVPESQYEAMRAPFQEGAFPGPVKYGYSNVGRVVRGPDGLEGRTVFCLYPHQTAYVVPADVPVAVPDDVPAGRAVLAANMETALNALWDGAIEGGARVAVIGAGVVGCLVAYLADKLAGADVVLIDVDPGKEATARALGVAFHSPQTAGSGFARLFHASGSAAGLRLALEIAGFEAEIIELSWYGDSEVSLPLGEAFHSRRLTLRASQVGHVAPAFRETWSRRDRLEHALSLLADPALDALISGESRFDDLPETMPRLIREPRGVLCHRIAYAASAAR